jgi:hypothetical protein
MAKSFTLTHKLLSEAEDALNAVHENITEVFNDQWEEKSERWQESDKGQAVLAWIEELTDKIEEAEAAIADIIDAEEFSE